MNTELVIRPSPGRWIAVVLATLMSVWGQSSGMVTEVHRDGDKTEEVKLIRIVHNRVFRSVYRACSDINGCITQVNTRLTAGLSR